jgi:hypothetical protein
MVARLVGVEFIVDAATWLASPEAPVLEGQSFQLVGKPRPLRHPCSVLRATRLGLADGPGGAFVDWNDRVTCEGQRPEG